MSVVCATCPVYLFLLVLIVQRVMLGDIMYKLRRSSLWMYVQLPFTICPTGSNFLFNTLFSNTPKLSVYCENMRDLPRLYLKIKFTEISDLFLQLFVTCDQNTQKVRKGVSRYISVAAWRDDLRWRSFCALNVFLATNGGGLGGGELTSLYVCVLWNASYGQLAVRIETTNKLIEKTKNYFICKVSVSKATGRIGKTGGPLFTEHWARPAGI